MASEVPSVGSDALAGSSVRALLARGSREAWAAIAATALFLGITCWWLTQDRSIPIFDAGLHLVLAFNVQSALAASHIVKALTLASPYPPLAYLVGSLGISIGGVSVAAPILAENFVFVPLLALGCYHVGRIAFGRLAGLLAVVFALGSPLMIAQFHVFMIDAPETAMVAVSLWAILATEGFSRVAVSALAGLAVGLGMLSKEPFIAFVAGPLAVSAIRGGPRAWRGMLAFALVALVIAAPWYLHQISTVEAIGADTVDSAAHREYPGDIVPARFSLDNFTWYPWSLLNLQLYLPLFACSAIGWTWSVLNLARRRPVSRMALELLSGAFLGWLVITETFVHDGRYGMPLLVYAAVFAAGWIARLPRRGRMVMAAGLVAVALANTAGVDFGAGGDAKFQLPGAKPGYAQRPGVVTIFSSTGFLVGAPRRDGDMAALLSALRNAGIEVAALLPGAVSEADFSGTGLVALGHIAGLETKLLTAGTGVISNKGYISLRALNDSDVVLFHGPLSATRTPPCLTLGDGTGVWTVRGDPQAAGARFFCPLR